jgi:hypothetical protein
MDGYVMEFKQVGAAPLASESIIAPKEERLLVQRMLESETALF